MIVNIYDELQMLNFTNLHAKYSKCSKRRDIKNLSCTLWKLCELPNKWVMHSCNVKGCRGYITTDGNDKLKRPICAAPRCRVKFCKDLPTIVECCTNYPLFGGRHQVASKYCYEHQDLIDGATNEVILDENDLPELQTLEKAFVGDFPSNIDDSLLVGCKKPENRMKYYLTTAGMLALIRPCGIIVGMTEMYTCKSPTQVFLFLLRTFVRDAHSVLRLRYLGYD